MSDGRCLNSDAYCCNRCKRAERAEADAYGCPDCGNRHKPEDCRTPRWENYAAEADLLRVELEKQADRAERAEAAMREHANQYAGHLDHAKNCPVCLLVARHPGGDTTAEPEASDG